MSKTQLKVCVKDGELQISIPIDTLCHSVDHGLATHYGMPISINSGGAFAVGIKQELESEDEEGATLVHKMFDQAASNAIENGCQGVDLLDEDD